MIPPRLMERLRRDGWLLGALLACVAACLLLNAAPAESTQDERISRVLSAMAGAGHTEVAIYYDAQDVPCGALVLASGADDVAIRLQMNRAVSTLLGLPAEAVAVYPLAQGSAD
ncbi:MAG: hypothetical protein IJE07_14690 [Clostridia bacterium]|nr:hypothetical protein [Clostridia bacterium]